MQVQQVSMGQLATGFPPGFEVGACRQESITKIAYKTAPPLRRDVLPKC